MSFFWKPRNALLATMLALGCTGSIGVRDEVRAGDGITPKAGDPRPSAGAAPVGDAFVCEARPGAVELPLRRLTASQYSNTVNDLIARLLPEDATVARAIAPLLDRMPADERVPTAQDHAGTFRRLDQDIEQSHVEAAYELARALGAELTRPAVLGRVVGACAADTETSNDAFCLTAFIERFGLLALRRPPTPAEVTHHRGAGGYADVIAALLMSPQFVFHVETGQTPVPGRPDTYGLSPYELASRLSYHFWDTMPDAALFEAARTGALATPEGRAAQVDRLLAHPRAREVVRAFFQDWFKLDALPPLESRNGEPIFKVFAGAHLPSPSLRGQMIDEVLTLAQRITLDDQGSLARLFLDERVLVRGPELAALYGVMPWNGTAAPSSFPAGERTGLLSRAAFHAYGSANTRPVMKGVFVRRALLCDELPPPPDAAQAADEPTLSKTLSTRQVVEAITEQPGTVCASCHGPLLNGIGFATENFDALGRLRRTQALYDEAGRVVGAAPVDTRARPQIIVGDTSEVSGVAGLAQKIVESGKAHACAARQYFRFTFGRWEDVARDGCALEELRRKLTVNQSLREMLRAAALLPAFSERYIPGGRS